MTEKLLRDTAAFFGEECVDRFETWLMHNQDEDWLAEIALAFETLPGFCGFVDLRHKCVSYFNMFAYGEYVVRLSGSSLHPRTWVLSTQSGSRRFSGSLAQLGLWLERRKKRNNLDSPVSLADFAEHVDSLVVYHIFHDDFHMTDKEFKTQEEANLALRDMEVSLHEYLCVDGHHDEFYENIERCAARNDDFTADEWYGRVAHAEEDCPFSCLLWVQTRVE